ncbi:hypothetical protein [Aliidiomarina sanyensis]|uniref:Uncharacterized protein n=1 Tax=Aliidiomarina sanyensis TaxID=1249555 RepID=A0A432WRQ1_9GAMM|nr:hypothetical protein [Aliidiomarina sanyensis]RUO36476.1 hypothetical protein CWE11_01285 [Aliidiomarina sanyensis]
MMLDPFDVRPYLVSAADMESFEEDAEMAADHLNGMIYAIERETGDSDFWTSARVEQLIVEISDLWIREPSLIESEPDELDDYIVHLIRRIEQESEFDAPDDSTEVLDEG